MNVFTVILRVLDAFPIQNLIAMHVLAIAYPRRRHFWLRLFLHALPMLIMWDVTKQAYPDNMLANPILDKSLMMIPLLYTFLGTLFCYTGSFTESVFCASCAAILENISINIWYLIKLNVGFAEGSPVSLAFSLGLLLACCIPFYYVIMRRIPEVKWSPFVKRQILAISCLFLILQTFFNNHVPGATWEYAVYITYIIADIAILIVQIGLSRESILEQKYAVIEELLRSEQKKQQMTAENVELINRKCHDLKHQIAGLKRMYSEADRDAYIRDIESAVMFYESAIKTGNETLDLILMDKLLYCQAHEIKLTCISDGEKLGRLETMDIYTLFGNAIDNAIESVSGEPDANLRVITMRIGSWGEYLTIHIENYLDREVSLSDGLPLTTKSDKGYHGFGVLSIRHIVEKYHGEMNIRTDDHMFRLDILIPLT